MRNLVIFLSIPLLLLSACGSDSPVTVNGSPTPAATSPTVKAPQVRVISKVQVGPGLSYEITEYGYNIRATYAAMTAETLTVLERQVQTLSAQAATPITTDLLKDLAAIQERARTQGKPPSDLGPQAEGCVLDGWAAPTSPESGAKAYAYATCQSGFLQYTGTATTSARAYTDVPPSCNQSGPSAQCSSVAYGPPSCSSRAVAQTKNGSWLRDEGIWSNKYCS